LFEEVEMSATTRMLAVAAGLTLIAPTIHAAGPFQYHPVSPCRAADTRTSGGVMQAVTTRAFAIQNVCGIPIGAQAVSLNVTAVNPTADGFLTLFPNGVTMPTVSTVNYTRNQVVANGAIVPLGSFTTFPNADLKVTAGLNGTIHVVLDVTGYFQ
jgi:hypothetical protein